MAAGLIFFSLVCCGGVESTTPQPQFEFDTAQQNAVKATAVVALDETGRTVFVVTNPFGIGRAGIGLKSGEWPANVVLRFQRHGDPGGGFTSLEHLEITTARLHAVGSKRLTGRFDFVFLDATGRKPQKPLAPDRMAGQLRISVEDRDGTLEVTLPPHLLAGSNRIELHWIDAYRQ